MALHGRFFMLGEQGNLLMKACLGEVSKLLLVEQALALVSKYLASKASFMADHTNGGEDTSSNHHWILGKEVFPCSPREWLANKATPPHLGGLMSKYFAH
ncbi:hypothetical protein TIFTF001_026820 [Ficus carica]|uniref:Uncharacterized protein n=1 Tax=Ficus carica TaxID=3494 RepID=A0AA88IZ75_FICCA|nr:hypothetical protein TIFTF001_026820 [Ficus carica]